MATLHLRLAELPAYLEARAAGLRDLDLTKPFKVIRQLLVAETKLNFVGQHDPDGNAWAALVRARPRRQGARPGRDQILRDTGQLMASVTAGGFGALNQITPTSLVVGTSVAYARFHQHGTSRMVARPFLGLNEPLLQRARAILARHVKGLLEDLTP